MGFRLSNIEDHIIRLDLIGDFDAQDALEYPSKLEPFREKARAADTKIHIFTDTSEFGKLSVEGRRVFSEANKDDVQGKIAATGANRILRMMARFILVASGRSNIRFFENEADALDWLRDSK